MNGLEFFFSDNEIIRKEMTRFGYRECSIFIERVQISARRARRGARFIYVCVYRHVCVCVCVCVSSVLSFFFVAGERENECFMMIGIGQVKS